MQITELCNKYANQKNKILMNGRVVEKIFEMVNDKVKINETERKTKSFKNYKEKDLKSLKICKEESVELSDIFKEESTELTEIDGEESIESLKIYKKECMELLKNYKKKQDNLFEKYKKKSTKLQTQTEKITGKKRKYQHLEEKRNVKRKRTFVNYPKGFKDGDFHIINESDEAWIFNEDGRIEKNKILTQLILSEKEIKMIAMIKENFEENEKK